MSVIPKPKQVKVSILPTNSISGAVVNQTTSTTILGAGSNSSGIATNQTTSIIPATGTNSSMTGYSTLISNAVLSLLVIVLILVGAYAFLVRKRVKSAQKKERKPRAAERGKLVQKKGGGRTPH